MLRLKKTPYNMGGKYYEDDEDDNDDDGNKKYYDWWGKTNILNPYIYQQRNKVLIK